MGNLNKLYSSKGLTLFRQRVEYLKHGDSLVDIYHALEKIWAENCLSYHFAGDSEQINWLANYFVKNATFQEEEDYRICYSPGSYELGNSSPAPIEQFRVTSSGRLIPYLDFRISEPRTKVPITSVVLGPQKLNSEESVKQFFWKQINLTPLITRSKVPYRS